MSHSVIKPGNNFLQASRVGILGRASVYKMVELTWRPQCGIHSGRQICLSSAWKTNIWGALNKSDRAQEMASMCDFWMLHQWVVRFESGKQMAWKENRLVRSGAEIERSNSLKNRTRFRGKNGDGPIIVQCSWNGFGMRVPLFIGLSGRDIE